MGDDGGGFAQAVDDDRAVSGGAPYGLALAVGVAGQRRHLPLPVRVVALQPLQRLIRLCVSSFCVLRACAVVHVVCVCVRAVSYQSQKSVCVCVCVCVVYPRVPHGDEAVGGGGPDAHAGGLVGEREHPIGVVDRLEDLALEVVGHDLPVVAARPHLLAHPHDGVDRGRVARNRVQRGQGLTINRHVSTAPHRTQRRWWGTVGWQTTMDEAAATQTLDLTQASTPSSPLAPTSNDLYDLAVCVVVPTDFGRGGG